MIVQFIGSRWGSWSRGVHIHSHTREKWITTWITTFEIYVFRWTCSSFHRIKVRIMINVVRIMITRRMYTFLYEREMDYHLDYHFWFYCDRVCMIVQFEGSRWGSWSTWRGSWSHNVHIHFYKGEKWITTWITTFEIYVFGWTWSSNSYDQGEDPFLSRRGMYIRISWSWSSPWSFK